VLVKVLIPILTVYYSKSICYLYILTNYLFVNNSINTHTILSKQRTNKIRASSIDCINNSGDYYGYGQRGLLVEWDFTTIQKTPENKCLQRNKNIQNEIK